MPLQPGDAAAARPAGQVAPVVATGERVRLWRAVENAELLDIRAKGQFRNVPPARAVKYFATSPEGAAREAYLMTKSHELALRRGDISPLRPPYTLVETSAPRSIMTRQNVTVVDGGVETVVVPEGMFGTLSPPQILDYMPIPRR